MRAGIAGLRVPAPVAEGVELLDVPELEPRLLGDPRAQADFEGAVLERRERAEGKRIAHLRRLVRLAHHEHDRLILAHGEDCRVETDLDGCHLVPLPCFALGRWRSSRLLQVSFEGHR